MMQKENSESDSFDIRAEHACKIYELIMDKNVAYAFVATSVNDALGSIQTYGINPLLTGMLFNYGMQLFNPELKIDDRDTDEEYGKDAD